MINIFKNLHKVFKTKSTFQLLVVFLVFALSGSMSVFVTKPIIDFLKIDQYLDSYLLELIIRIIIIFPIYQVILLFIGTIFGQFNYFWNFQKKFFHKFTK